MGTPLIQPSFAGGEIAPALYDRVDIQRYGTSLRTCKNFIVRPYGGVDNRPGTRFIGEVKDSTRVARLLKFRPTSEIAYIIILNAGVMQFVYQGAFIESSPGVRVEVVIPYADDELFDIKFTQSNDVMYLVHGNHEPQELRRLTATTFSLGTFVARNGPFRALNGDESLKMAASAVSGQVTVTANYAAFTANAVGSLIYMEQKDLTGVRPWETGDRNVALNAQRRSDGKTYRASTIPTTPTGAGNWIQTGANKPVHESGKAWDGPGDTRSTGTNNYAVGVEWEYLHSGYGIVQVTEYVNATTVKGVVTKRLPDSVVGGLGSPGTTWTISPDGVSTTYAIAGAVSSSAVDYAVTLSGTPVQSNPYYEQPPSSGGPAGGTGGRGTTGTQIP